MATATEAAQRLLAAAAQGALDELCRRLRVRLLGLFGSAARGASTIGSGRRNRVDTGFLSPVHPAGLGHLLSLGDS